MTDPRKLAILLTISLLIGACFSSHVEAQEKSKTNKKQLTAPKTVSTKQLEAWVNQLSEGNFRERRTASNNLSKVGEQALPALIKGAQRKDVEVSARCVAIVIEMYQGNNKTLKSAAEKALNKLKKSSNALVAQRATIATKKPERVQRPQWVVVGQLGRRQNPANLVRIGDRIVGIGDWKKKFSDNGKTISIEKKNGAISIEVIETVKGKLQTKRYKAKNEAGLKKKHPELYKLYEKHDRRRAQVANFIQLGNRIPVANGRQKLAGGWAIVQNPNRKKIDDAEKKLNESLDQLNEIVKADKINDRKLKILNAKIQKLRITLKALKK